MKVLRRMSAIVLAGVLFVMPAATGLMQEAAPAEPNAVETVEAAETVEATAPCAEEAEETPETVDETAADPEADLEANLEAEGEVKADPEAEPETESEPEEESEPETEPETETEPEVKPEPETESESEAEPETEPEQESEPETESEPEVKSELETESESEAEPETEPETESEPEAKAEPEVKAEPEAKNEQEAEASYAPFVCKEATDVREKPDGLSPILLTVPEGTELAVSGAEGDWLFVTAQGVKGYVYRYQKDESPKQYAEKKVTIFSSRRVKMTLGETVTLTSRLQGFEDCEDILFQWECDKGAGFAEVPGANGGSHFFTADRDSLSWNWRLQVYYR